MVRKKTTPKNGRDKRKRERQGQSHVHGHEAEREDHRVADDMPEFRIGEQRVVEIVEADEGRLLGKQVPLGHRVVDDRDQRPEKEDQEADQRRADEQPGFQHLPVFQGKPRRVLAARRGVVLKRASGHRWRLIEAAGSPRRRPSATLPHLRRVSRARRSSAPWRQESAGSSRGSAEPCRWRSRREVLHLVGRDQACWS